MIYEQTIDQFLTLLRVQPLLFVEHRTELEQLADTLPTEPRDAANAIVRWCKGHPSLYQALSQALNAFQERGYSPNIPASQPARDYADIQNQIRASMPSPADSAPPSPLPPDAPPSPADSAPPSPQG